MAAAGWLLIHVADVLRGRSDNAVVYAELPWALHQFDMFHSARSTAVVNGIETFATWVLTSSTRAADPGSSISPVRARSGQRRTCRCAALNLTIAVNQGKKTAPARISAAIAMSLSFTGQRTGLN